MSFDVEVEIEDFEDFEDAEEQETRNTGLPIQFDGNVKEFTRKAKLFAMDQIRIFFKDLRYHCGGSIPQRLLYSEQSINTVLSYPFCEGIDLCHCLIEDNAPPNWDEGRIEWSTYCILGMLRQTHALNIEASLRSGMMLLFLKLCKGKKIPEIELNVTHLLP